LPVSGIDNAFVDSMRRSADPRRLGFALRLPDPVGWHRRTAGAKRFIRVKRPIEVRER
jgi:hypothetical protein